MADQPAVGDPAVPVDPDVGHIGRRGAVDDLLARVVDVGQAGAVAPQPDNVGPLAGLKRPDPPLKAERPRPLDSGHGQHVAGGQGPRIEPGHLLELSDFADHRPRALSGGMRMRVSLARSLTLEPELFLFDEPFGALDEIARERLNDELLQLYLTQRFTALFVTHSVAEAVFLSTRVVVMSARPGRILADFAVPFGYPRSPRLRFEERYARLAGQVSARLRGGG